VQIRNATDSDLIDVFFLFLREYRETRAAEAKIPFRQADIMLKFILMIKQPEYGVLLVAEEEDQIVGYIYGPYHKGWDGHDDLITWHEVGWYVKKEHRGKGIGLALFSAAEERVRSDGKASHITVTTAVGSDHEKLMKKYEQAGFTPLQINFVKKIGEG